ncbi:TPA: hypothetical protein DEB00_02355 [Candidatus Uhrbacteria bacterium]|nr:hypothetical protein [Candidatus Uhrbacteria bacterium]
MVPKEIMTWLASIVLLSIYGYFCTRTVRKGILVFAACLPLYLIKLSVGPIPTNFLELMFIVLFVVWALGFLQERRRDSLKHLLSSHKRLSLGILLLLLGGCLGLLQTGDLLSALNVLKSYLVEPLLLGAMIWSVSRSSENFHLRQFLVALSVPVIVLSVFALFQTFTGLAIPEAWALERRVTGLYPYPNALGHFVAPIITVLAVLFMDDKSRFTTAQRRILGSAFFLGIISVYLAQTEAALLAIAVSLFLVSFLYKKGAAITVPLLLCFILTVLIVSPLRTTIVQKITLQDWSGQTRITQWKETGHFLLASPRHFLLGAGPNNYPAAISPYHTYTHLEIFQYPHNIFLNAWVEFGVLGLAGFCLIAYSLWKITIRKSNSYYVVAFGAGLAEMVIHGLVDVPFLKNDLAFLGAVFVVLLLIASEKEKPFSPKQLLR